jgi:mono/diheme cytochrome c family protein
MLSKKQLILGGLFATASGAAWAFPWDIDMVDSVFLRAFEWEMMDTPEGALAVDTPANGDRYTPEGKALKSPYETGDAAVANGKRMFEIYCATCHGAEGKGGAQVTRNDPANGIKRYQYPPPMLSGPGALSTIYSDGYIYLTVRNGGHTMPAYSYAMDDDEMWNIVTYIRTLDGAQFKGG